MSGHTPGPWVVQNGTDVFTRLGAFNGAGVEAAGNDGWYVCDCHGGTTCTARGVDETLSHQEEVANARLIAAAPELLVAAKAAVAALTQAKTYPGDVNIAVQWLREAIAKATEATP